MKYPELAHTLSEVYNETYHLGKLPPVPHAIRSIQRLHQAGASLHVVSSYTDQYEAMKTRERNLEAVFGEVFQSFTALPLGSSKYDYISKHSKDSLFVEDSPKNLVDAIKAGLDPRNCYLVAQPYNLNSELDDVVFRGNWVQITHRIFGET